MQQRAAISIATALGVAMLAGCAQTGASEAGAEHQAQPIALAIHGGAGTITRENMSTEREAEFTAALNQAMDAGYAVLEDGGSSMDAVLAAIQVMEEEPLFNAGRGAVYTYDGTHELDASVMDGETGNAGAVAGVATVRSPIALARLIMDESRHVMLSGDGAAAFAAEHDLEQVSNDYFNTDHRYEQLERALERLREADDAGEQIAFTDASEWQPALNMGTVGAVAVDQEGNLAAGTSTGGMTAKQYGRIGDSPIIGAGTWADNDSCAVSATGHGEYFIRYQVAADICSRVKYQQKSIVEAGDEVIHDILLPAGGTGGVIIADADGQLHMPFNTEGMYRAAQSSTTERVIGIYSEEE